MVKTRQTRIDLRLRRFRNLKRGGGICKRFKPPADQPKVPIKSAKGRPKKRVQYELPDYTQWFDIDSINCIEEECADNIFIGYGHDRDALHEVYKKVRNKIVELYRIEPTKFLTVTDCIRRLGMDASIVMKVHSLLNYWGIINYQATNSFGERIFNKKLNEKIVDLKGNQSNVHRSRVKLDFNQILDKDATEVSVNTYYNSQSYNDFTKCDNCSKKKFDFNSIEDVVRYSSELNSGHYGMNLNYPRCSGCRNPCKTSYYILGPESLGEVSNTIRNRGIWCSLCYCNSNYPITLSKDSFVRIDIPPRLSETISKLFQKNSNLLYSSNITNKINGNFDSKGNRLRETLLKSKKLNSNLSKNRKGANKQISKLPLNSASSDDNSVDISYNSNDNLDNFGNSTGEDSFDNNDAMNMTYDTVNDLADKVVAALDDYSNYKEDTKELKEATIEFNCKTDESSNVQPRDRKRGRLNKKEPVLEKGGDGDASSGSPVVNLNTEVGSRKNPNESNRTTKIDDEVCNDRDANKSLEVHGRMSNGVHVISKDRKTRCKSDSLSEVKTQGGSSVKMPWTSEDFERLYEAIRKYGTDWQSVAQHLGEDSTPNECVFQFINAPLEKEVTSKLKLTTYMDTPASMSLGAQFPFFDSPNTIVTLLSFCASVLSPVIASYAAKAAFNTILKSSKKSNGALTNKTNQVHSINSNENSTSGSVSSHSSNSVTISVKGVETAINNIKDLRNGLISNGTDGTNASLNSLNNTGNGADINNFDGGHRFNNHVNSTEQKNGAPSVDEDEVEKKINLSDGISVEVESKRWEKVNKLVDGNTLQLAAAAALGAAAARAGELADKEEERLSEALPHLISLKIKRISQKLNKYNDTQEKMKSDQAHLEKEMFRILKCKGFFQDE